VGAISNIFTDGTTYAYRPWDEPIKGREAIVADWLSDQDAPGTWTAKYRPFVIAGSRAVAIGELGMPTARSTSTSGRRGAEPHRLRR
jgi:hypothetical protein